MPALIPDDVAALGRVYGFSVEGYVNFAPERVRARTLEHSPLMTSLHAGDPSESCGAPCGEQPRHTTAQTTESLDGAQPHGAVAHEPNECADNTGAVKQ